VQNVGFRYFVLRRARAMGLSGWVRNRPEGTVECLAEGDARALQELLRALEHGPQGARVTRLEVEWGPAGGDLAEFNLVW
jgi:acylphosphatase